MFKNVLIFCVVSLMSVGCGQNYGGNGGAGGGNYAGQAQGVYSGTSSNGYTFSAIVIPNDKFYTIYSTVSGSTVLLFGLVTGQGTSGSGTYTASVTDFSNAGPPKSGSINANYVAGSSLNGTLTENATTTTFTGNAEPASSFTYNTAASLAAITGSWTGTLLDGMTTTLTINPDGSVSGSSAGCSLSGTVAPDTSNKNFFDVSLTFGASPCSPPDLTVTGVAVEFLLSDGVTHQLVAGASAGTSFGTAFGATR